MPRTDRLPNQAYPEIRDMHKHEAYRCQHTIVLRGQTYGCMRQFTHNGAHDAFCSGPDGYLVIW